MVIKKFNLILDNTSLKELLQQSQEEGDLYYENNDNLTKKIQETRIEINRMIMEYEDKVEQNRLLQNQIEDLKEKVEAANHRCDNSNHKLLLLEKENDAICKEILFIYSNKIKISRIIIP